MTTVPVRCLLCGSLHITEPALVPDWLRAHTCRPATLYVFPSTTDHTVTDLLRSTK